MEPLLIQYSTVASRNTEPFRWQAAGMGYVIRTSNGRFIVIDGGFAVDAEPLVELLCEHSDGRPEVDLWMITHPHIDHYGAALELSHRPELRARLNVRRFLYCMPPDEFGERQKNISVNDLRRVREIPQNFGVPAYHAATGDRYLTDDAVTEVLLTFDDLATASDGNECSMITRITLAGQRMLFLADTYGTPSRQLAAKAGHALESEFCQLAHHALNGGAGELYDLVRPRIALVPMARPAYDAMLYGEYKDSHGTRHNRKVLQNLPKEDQWISADGTKIVPLPYSFHKNT